MDIVANNNEKGRRKDMDKAQAPYTRDFDSRVSRNPLPIYKDHYVFLRKNHHNYQKEKRHKLYPIADEPYRFVSTDDCGPTVVLGMKEDHECISRDRVVLEPSPS